VDAAVQVTRLLVDAFVGAVKWGVNAVVVVTQGLATAACDIIDRIFDGSDSLRETNPGGIEGSGVSALAAVARSAPAGQTAQLLAVDNEDAVVTVAESDAPPAPLTEVSSDAAQPLAAVETTEPVTEPVVTDSTPPTTTAADADVPPTPTVEPSTPVGGTDPDEQTPTTGSGTEDEEGEEGIQQAGVSSPKTSTETTSTETTKDPTTTGTAPASPNTSESSEDESSDESGE
jgi:hypothetical protein